MEKLNVRFHESINERLKAVVSTIGFDDSKVARCAMDLGLKALEDLIESGDQNSASGRVGIRMLRENLLNKS